MRAVILLLFLAGTWLLWSGIYDKSLILTFGAVSVFLTTWLCVRLRTTDEEGAPFHVLIRALIYIPWLVLEIVKANIDVTKRILFGGNRITPVLFEAPASQKTDLGRVIYANSITLTPGTVSYAIDGDKILVHAIATDVRDGVLTGVMDRRCSWVEGAGGGENSQ